MTNLIVLDVVIGLIFVYLLYSMLATVLIELMATWFSFRSKLLERAIFRMLEDGSLFDKRFSSLKALFRKSNHIEKTDTPAGEFYRHPLIKYLAEDKYNSKPSYITKETFAKVVIDLLRGDKLNVGDDIKSLIEKSLNEKKLTSSGINISPDTLKYIETIWIDAQGDIDTFRKLLEQWFNETMERCSGWYKKHTQYILLLIGLLIAITFNVNSIAIVEKLEKDPKLREAVLQQADDFTKAHPNLYQERINDLSSNYKTYNSPVTINKMDNSTKNDNIVRQITYTKSDSLARAKSDSLINRGKALTLRADSLIQGDIAKSNKLLGTGLSSLTFRQQGWDKFLSTILGWLITALAISLGAPFWFDLLNRLMKLRSSITNSVGSQSTPKKTAKAASSTLKIK